MTDSITDTAPTATKIQPNRRKSVALGATRFVTVTEDTPTLHCVLCGDYVETEVYQNRMQLTCKSGHNRLASYDVVNCSTKELLDDETWETVQRVNEINGHPTRVIAIGDKLHWATVQWRADGGGNWFAGDEYSWE